MSKKNLLAVFVLATAGFFVSCSSDDDKTTPIVEEPITEEPTPHALEGTWKAETVSYQAGPSVHEWNFTQIKGGCATDYLSIQSEGVTKLTENNKNEAGDCEDVLLTGSWTEGTVTIPGEESAREVVSVDETTLLLKYPYSFMGQNTDITVKYSRQ